jgi:hypothetical protein
MYASKLHRRNTSIDMLEFPTRGARPVWLASYPRSGNTFLRILLERVFGMPSYSAYYVEGTEHRDPSAEALQDAPRLPWNWKERLTDSTSAPQIVIKTHDLPSDNAPAIYIARDGRAAIDSYFHYHQKFAFEQPSLTEVIAGACQFGSWSDHYLAWRPKVRPNTLLVVYDELVGAPETVIDKLATFLDRTPKPANLPEFEQLQKKLPAFFRRGQNTDYLKAWAPEQILLFNELHAKAMEDLGLSVNPQTGSANSLLPELAQTASRLHRLYLQQLSNVAQMEANQRQQQQAFDQRLQELTSSLAHNIKGLLQKPWVKLGLALGAVRLPSIPGQNLAQKPAGLANGASLKSSDESNQSS